MTPDKISIDAAKQLHSLPWISPELKSALENDFPELKESEEDENLFDLLHTCVCRCITDPNWEYQKRENVSKKIIPFIERLRFLRPQPHWKPSEEHEIVELSFKGGTYRVNGEENTFKGGKAKIIILEINQEEENV